MRRWRLRMAGPPGLVGRATMVFALVCLLVAAAVAVAQGVWQMHMLIKPLRITAADAEQLGRAAMPVAVALAAFGVFGLVARCRRSARLCFLCFALFVPVGANAGMGVIDVVFDAHSGRQIASRLSDVPAGTELAGLECFPNGLSFYLGRPATLISRDGHELTSNYIMYCLNQDARWPKRIVPLADFDGWLASQKTPVYLIVHKSDRKNWKPSLRPGAQRFKSFPRNFLAPNCRRREALSYVWHLRRRLFFQLVRSGGHPPPGGSDAPFPFPSRPGRRRPGGHGIGGVGRDAAGDPRPVR
jgi:hypothetical protein